MDRQGDKGFEPLFCKPSPGLFSGEQYRQPEIRSEGFERDESRTVSEANEHVSA
jgi:hypothetical protein